MVSQSDCCLTNNHIVGSYIHRRKISSLQSHFVFRITLQRDVFIMGLTPYLLTLATGDENDEPFSLDKIILPAIR